MTHNTETHTHKGHAFTLTKERNAQNKIEAYKVTLPHRALTFWADHYYSVQEARHHAMKQAQEQAHTLSVTLGLLDRLPCSYDELQQRVKQERTSVCHVASILCDVIKSDVLTQEQGDRLGAFGKVLGEAVHVRSCCCLYHNAPNKRVKERAFSLLFHTTEGEKIFNTLNSTEKAILSAPWVRSMLRQGDHVAKHLLATLYTANKEAGEQQLETFTFCRFEVGASPSVFSELERVMTEEHKSYLLRLLIFWS